jgi:hypothetical protein
VLTAAVQAPLECASYSLPGAHDDERDLCVDHGGDQSGAATSVVLADATGDIGRESGVMPGVVIRLGEMEKVHDPSC